jgi:large subunit ribosomal protein L15
LKIHEARPKPKSRSPRKRIGRGNASGTGKTAGRGENGAKSRSGWKTKVGFEGGQLPLIRRLPKRGFHNPFRTQWAEVNVESLVRFEAGSVVDEAALREARLINGRYDKIVILGRGEIDRALTVRVNRVSGGAATKIEAAGGSVEVL